MFKLLRSLFNRSSKGGYPDALVKQAIERAVDGTDPCLRAVSGYRKKLRPAVITAIDHVVAMVEALSPPLPVNLGGVNEDPRLRGYFISGQEMLEVFLKDRNLNEFVKRSASPPARAVALLAMEKQEGITFGADISGDIVISDVPMVTVSFNNHRLIDPTPEEKSTRRALKIRAFDHLVGLALKRLSLVKAERADLERRRALLQAKLDLFHRQGWGFDPSAPTGETTEELENRLETIKSQLDDFGGDDSEYESYMNIVAEVLGSPSQYVMVKEETLFVDKLGIKQTGKDNDARELVFGEFRDAEGRSLVVLLVSLDADQLRRLIEENN